MIHLGGERQLITKLSVFTGVLKLIQVVRYQVLRAAICPDSFLALVQNIGTSCIILLLQLLQRKYFGWYEGTLL